MLNALKNHPFAVEAFFKNSTVLTFAIPKEELENKIPKHLKLDTFKDKWAFVAIAMVQTQDLRPKGFPKFMGNNFFLIGYRVFVTYTNKAGKRLRGLYILKSETNKKKMQLMGNIFTHYNYTTTDITITKEKGNTEISSLASKFKVNYNDNLDLVNLPEDSPFSDYKEARRFAGPLPFTFTYKKENNTILIIQGVRQNWIPSPIHINKYHFNFLEEAGFKNPILANAFSIKNIPYHWKKGKLELW